MPVAKCTVLRIAFKLAVYGRLRHKRKQRAQSRLMAHTLLHAKTASGIHHLSPTTARTSQQP